MTEPLRYADLSDPNDWLHGSDLAGKAHTLTITAVSVELFADDARADAKTRRQGVLEFAKTLKRLGLNRTNRECLRAMFGPDDPSQDVVPLWTGKRVTFFPSPERNPATGKVEPAVRIKGSPDIAAAITFTLNLPRRKPRQVTLVRTGPAAVKEAEPAKEAEPDDEPDFGEPEWMRDDEGELG